MIELTLDPDPYVARVATDRIGSLAFLATGEIIDAYPRAEVPDERRRLIQALGAMAPRWHGGAQSLLGRIARDELNEGLRRQAEATGRYLDGDEGFDDGLFDEPEGGRSDGELGDGLFDGEIGDPFDDDELDDDSW